MLGRGAGLLRGNGLLHRLGAGVQAGHWAGDGAVGTNGSGRHGRAASSGPSDGLKEHCVCAEKGSAQSQSEKMSRMALQRPININLPRRVYEVSE